jgi:hypothetical protein
MPTQPRRCFPVALTLDRQVQVVNIPLLIAFCHPQFRSSVLTLTQKPDDGHKRVLRVPLVVSG